MGAQGPIGPAGPPGAGFPLLHGYLGQADVTVSDGEIVDLANSVIPFQASQYSDVFAHATVRGVGASGNTVTCRLHVRTGDGATFYSDVADGTVPQGGTLTPFLKLLATGRNLFVFTTDLVYKLAVEASGGDCVVYDANLWIARE